MFAKILTFLLVLTSVNSWELNVNDNQVIPLLSSDVVIQCLNDKTDSSTKTIKEILLIQISKFINNDWQKVASITPSDPEPRTSFIEANTTGYIDNGSTNSFLQIYFPVADKQTIGHYECYIEGLNENRETKSITTEKVFISQRSVNDNDMLELIRKVHQQEKDHQSDWVMLTDRIGDLTKSMSDINVNVKQIHDDLQKVTTEKDTMKSAIDNITKMNNDQSKKIDDLKMYISHLETVDNDLKVYINNVSTQQEILHKNIYDNITSLTTELWQKDTVWTWPAGKYSIPEPDTGCPNTTTYKWAPSSYRISTAPNNNNDSHSSNLHLAGSVFEKIDNNNYFTMKLCSMTGDRCGLAWPAGSYCVQMYFLSKDRVQDCPNGFPYYGYIRYGRFNDNSKDVFNNLPGFDTYDHLFFIYYCCRKDGSPTNPIILPTLQPFYLYRYGGTCQEVAGMEVSDEWIHTDTGKWGEKDEYFNVDEKGWHYEHKNNPDGSITNGVTIQICYYTPRN